MSSFDDSGMEEGAHAYVSYVDCEREVVPLTFIQKFPSSWQEQGWDKNYLYKVFWSPQEDDCPASMLRRVPAIPVYEVGTAAAGNPGFYRASVLLVAESREKLENLIDTKRVTVELRKRYSSFDMKTDNPQSGSIKQESSGSKSNDKIKKKGKGQGINRVAYAGNVSHIKADLKKHFGSSPKVDDGKNITDTSIEKHVPSKKSDHKSSGPSTSSGGKRISRTSAPIHDNTSSDEGEASLVIGGKKVKIDPDFTPKKLEELKVELSMKQQTITKLTNFNLRLNKSLEDLQAKYEEAQRKLASQGLGGASDETSISPPKSDVITSSNLSFSPGAADPSVVEVTCEPDVVEAMQSSSPSQIIPKSSSALSDDIVNTRVENPVALMEESSSSTMVHDKKSEEECEEKPKESSPKESTKALVDGVNAPDEVWEYIGTAKRGEKGDLFYIKSLSVVTFGPEVLSASSIKGTKRGPKRKNHDAPVTAKPPLDKALLQKVYKCFVKRVEDELGTTILIPEKNPRTKDLRFHDAIRQVQKKYRAAGYGNGVKDNTVSIALLNATDL